MKQLKIILNKTNQLYLILLKLIHNFQIPQLKNTFHVKYFALKILTLQIYFIIKVTHLRRLKKILEQKSKRKDLNITPINIAEKNCNLPFFFINSKDNFSSSSVYRYIRVLWALNSKIVNYLLQAIVTLVVALQTTCGPWSTKYYNFTSSHSFYITLAVC